MQSSWIQRGISPATEGSRLHDPLVQPWTYIEQPGTPQQNNFNNTKETRLACGIYTVLSALYAIRSWNIDFVLQSHIRQARHWMAAIAHAIHEVVSLHRCSCGLSYEQWANQPTPPCLKCGGTSLPEGGGGTKKRAYDDIRNNTPANLTLSPDSLPGHRQNHMPKRLEDRPGPFKKPREPNPNSMRNHFSRVGGRGLRNCGNTCFLNAAIQCLGAIDEVNQAQKATNKPTTTQEKLMQCIRELQQPGAAYVPTSLIQQIPHLICYTKGEPADAHELLIAMINIISTPIFQIFQGQMASTVQCAHCDRVTTTMAHTQDISLHVDEDSHASLGERLLTFFQPETLEGDTYTGVTHVFDPAGQRKHSPTLTFPQS